MSEYLYFPIGFDLEAGAEEVMLDWNKTYQARIAESISKNPVAIKLKITEKSLSSLEDVKAKLKELKIEPITPETKASIESLVRELRTLEEILIRIDRYNAAYSRTMSARASSQALEWKRAEQAASGALRNEVLASRVAVNNARAEAHLALAKERRVRTETRLSQALAKSLGLTKAQTSAYSSQAVALNGLINKATIYTALWSGLRFLNTIRETTAQFELQKVALGALLRDGNAAADIFERIKRASVESPFEVKELVNFTKQLAAYNVQADQLFDTMMQLADISAGLGVGMDRLVLAYGQVKSAAVLRGTELRQFTEAGIPLVQMLADKFSELRGETVSTAEVFELISSRAVSFGMVADIFKEMTSAGGMFYDMQTKQAQTLAGQWTNLKDAISIAYDEMGRTDFFQGGVRFIIDVVKSLAENWKSVAKLTSSAAMGIGVYAVAVKNATIATKALTVAETVRSKVITASTISTNKYIAKIIGETAAKKASIFLSRQLYKARIAEITATNLLTKAWARLKIAMLTNPWSALIAILSSAVVALGLFSNRAETAEDRVKKLNKAVSDFQGANKKLQLVQEYEKLSEKASKTEAEQKKLNSMTKELIDAFPLAAKGAKGYANALEVSADKAKDLALKNRELARSTLQTLYEIELANVSELEQKANAATGRVERLRSYYEKAIESGEATELTINWRKKRFESAIEEKEELDAELESSRTNLERLGVALGYIEDKTTTAIEEFGLWKKTLSEATESYIDAAGELKERPLFDKEALASADSLDKMLDKAAENYNKALDDIVVNARYMNSAIAENDETQETYFKNLITNAEYSRDANYKLLEQYNALDKITESVTGGENSRVAALKQQAKLLQDIYDRYQQIRQYKSADEAQAMVRSEFAGSIAQLNVSPVFDPDSLRTALLQFSEIAKSMGEDELAVELGFKANEASWNALVDDVKTRTAKLRNDVERASKAQDFFSKMLGITGDRELSSSLTLSVYGTTGDDLAQAMLAQIKDAFRGVDIADAILGDNVDYAKLETYIPKIKVDEQREIAKEIVNNWRDSNKQIVEDIYKTYEDFMTYEQRKTRVVATENAERAKIMSQALPEEEREKLIEASRNREAEALGAIAIEEFKASEDWIKTFENVESLATPVIRRLMGELREFIETNKKLTPAQVKTLMREYNEFAEALIERNPWETLIDSMKRYRDASQQIPGLTEAVAKAERDVKAAQLRLASAKEATAYAEQRSISEGTEEAAFGLADAMFEEDLAAMNLAEAIEVLTEAIRKLTGAQNDQQDALSKFAKGAQVLANKLSMAETLIRDFMETLGIAEDSDAGAFLKGMADAFGFLAKVALLAKLAVELFNEETKKFLTTNPFGWILLIGSAIVGALSMISNVKVRKANKEIERQQRLLDNLEKTYDKLNKTAQKAFGTEYLENYNDRLSVLYAKQEAYLKQAEAERSKGKKADQDKIDDYKDSALETSEAIAEMQAEVQERFAGTDLASAARDFANAWLEAYRTFGSTSDAIGDKFREMIQNMVVESLAGRIMQKLLEPIFTEIDRYSKDGELDEREIASIADLAATSIEGINSSMVNLVERLRAAGYDIRDTSTGLSGISKSIASASEESILSLAAGINTQNFYISQIHARVASIDSKMGAATTTSSGIDLQNLFTMQNQHLAQLPNIATNTALTAERCERAAAACERIADSMDRVIKPRGTQATHTVNTSL